MPKISKNIRKFRTEKNLTQDALAEKLHVTRQAVSNWENDKTKPDIEALEALATALEVEIEELIYGEKKEIIISQDKTKEKNRIKIILAIVGSLLVASGLALVFFGFWQNLSISMQTVFSVVPIIAGQAFAVYVFLKKKNNVLWRECASLGWTIGIVSTIALIDYIYNISWVYTDYLFIDSLLIIPVMFIMGAVAPLGFYYYMTVHIAITANVYMSNIFASLILFAVGVVFTFLLSRNKDNSQGKIAQWITVIASIPLFMIYVYAGFEAKIFSPDLSVEFAFLLSYFLCMFILSPEKDAFKLPYKPISLIGLCVSMLYLSVSGIYGEADVENNVLPFVISAVVCIFPPVVAGFIRGESFEDDKIRIGTTALPFAMIIWSYIYAIIDEFFMWRELENGMVDFSPWLCLITYLIGALLTLGFGALLVYQGVKELQLLTLNLGVITVFIQILGIYSYLGNINIFVLGILLVAFGVGLIVLNSKMVSLKKSVKEKGAGGDDNA